VFELSFAKIFVIAVVALIVLGPERLPAVARMAGTIVGRVQRFLASVKAEVNAQTEDAGLNTLKEDLQNSVNSVRESMQEAISEVQHSMSSLKEEVSTEVKAISEEVSGKGDVEEEVTSAEPDQHPAPEIDMEKELINPESSKPSSNEQKPT
jgi:sec-independent protein translocase protein TatB